MVHELYSHAFKAKLILFSRRISQCWFHWMNLPHRTSALRCLHAQVNHRFSGSEKNEPEPGAGVLSLFIGQRGSALWCVNWTEWHPVWSDSQREVQWAAFMAHWTQELFLNLHTRGLMPLAPLVCANEHFLWSTATSHAADCGWPMNICPLLQPHKWYQTVMVLHREAHCSH